MTKTRTISLLLAFSSIFLLALPAHADSFTKKSCKYFKKHPMENPEGYMMCEALSGDALAAYEKQMKSDLKFVGDKVTDSLHHLQDQVHNLDDPKAFMKSSQDFLKGQVAADKEHAKTSGQNVRDMTGGTDILNEIQNNTTFALSQRNNLTDPEAFLKAERDYRLGKQDDQNELLNGAGDPGSLDFGGLTSFDSASTDDFNFLGAGDVAKVSNDPLGAGSEEAQPSSPPPRARPRPPGQPTPQQSADPGQPTQQQPASPGQPSSSRQTVATQSQPNDLSLTFGYDKKKAGDDLVGAGSGSASSGSDTKNSSQDPNDGSGNGGNGGNGTDRFAHGGHGGTGNSGPTMTAWNGPEAGFVNQQKYRGYMMDARSPRHEDLANGVSGFTENKHHAFVILDEHGCVINGYCNVPALTAEIILAQNYNAGSAIMSGSLRDDNPLSYADWYKALVQRGVPATKIDLESKRLSEEDFVKWAKNVVFYYQSPYQNSEHHDYNHGNNGNNGQRPGGDSEQPGLG